MAISTTVAGHKVLVGVEAIDRSRPADRGWVDQMVGEHADLPTDKLVLVSASGFTADARAAAVASHAIPLAPEDVVDGDLSDGLIGSRPGVLTMEITFTVLKFGFKFDGATPPELRSDTPLRVTLENGTELSPTPQDYAEFLIADGRDALIAELGLDRSRESRAGTSSAGFENLTADVEGQSLRHGARNDDGIFFPLSSVQVEFDWKVDVTTLQMFRSSLDDQVYAAGQGIIAGPRRDGCHQPRRHRRETADPPGPTAARRVRSGCDVELTPDRAPRPGRPARPHAALSMHRLSYTAVACLRGGGSSR